MKWCSGILVHSGYLHSPGINTDTFGYPGEFQVSIMIPVIDTGYERVSIRVRVRV
jgi:hypothetical protein